MYEPAILRRNNGPSYAFQNPWTVGSSSSEMGVETAASVPKIHGSCLVSCGKLKSSSSRLAGNVKIQQEVTEIAGQTLLGSEDHRRRMNQNKLAFLKCGPNGHTV